ncbi:MULTISPECIES: hypothetical protein [Paenibacillus]|uniref:Uncharacterized protein n=1 Tax=Paenibacillus naphthalenovorans TaxID=162209 RepID=A0A0U2UC23_9BACL|nr:MULTISPECIES: hypothetical protein [Paenibacillus]ALS20732.1 hypothetical protein IJ22_03430 [Paenibacillus naphthalenovorans]GCL70762.1 hypothetical protein PN4B1_06640 [Paenibacillus naphthalenovorans]SDI23940.1 hypothetical protein SAMN05421868_104176 [Paenibacillus naphthalenovorans]
MNFFKWSIVVLLFVANIAVIVFGKKHFENQASAAGGYVQTDTASVQQTVYEDSINRVVK